MVGNGYRIMHARTSHVQYYLMNREPERGKVSICIRTALDYSCVYWSTTVRTEYGIGKRQYLNWPVKDVTGSTLLEYEFISYENWTHSPPLRATRISTKEFRVNSHMDTGVKKFFRQTVKKHNDILYIILEAVEPQSVSIQFKNKTSISFTFTQKSTTSDHYACPAKVSKNSATTTYSLHPLLSY